ncbi:MAG: hypothetical protein R3B09_10760 [Nannocystaceae bacterium]
MSLAAALVSLLSLAHAGAAGFERPVLAVLAEEPSDAELAKAEKGMELFESKRFADAADVFEELWRETGTARYLFNAAVARERLGHEAIAYVHLRRFLGASGLTEEEQSAGERRLRELLLRTSPLRVALSPPPPAGTTGSLVFTYEAGDRPPIEVDIRTFASRHQPGAVEINVEAGVWLVESRITGARPADGRVAVLEATPGAVTLNLTADVVPVQISVGPPDAIPGATLRWTPQAGGEATVIPASQAATLNLVPGVYTLEVTAPGYVTTTQRAVIGPRTEPLTVNLLPTEAIGDEPKKKKGNPVGLGLGITSGITGIAGVAILGVAASRFQDKSGAYQLAKPADVIATSDALRINLDVQERGAGLLGFGLGTATSAVLTMRRARPRAPWIEAGIGAGLAVIGGVTYGVAVRRSAASINAKDNWLVAPEGDAPELALGRPATILGAMVLGAGAGLVVGGVVKLAVGKRRKRENNLSLAPTFTGTSAQASLTGRF